MAKSIIEVMTNRGWVLKHDATLECEVWTDKGMPLIRTRTNHEHREYVTVGSQKLKLDEDGGVAI